MVIITVLIVFTLVLINLNFNAMDYNNLCKYKIINKIIDLSFISMKIKFKIIGIEYSNRKYLINCTILSLVLGTTFYFTINNLLYTLILLIICLFLFPYIQYLNFKSRFDAFIESNIFSYTQSSIIFLKEEKTVYNILNECVNNVSNPLKKDLCDAIKYIDKTSDFDKALDNIETKYRHTCIKNLHILLKGKLKYGTINNNLYDFLYHDIEDYELMISNFKLNKAANQKAFYFMMFLDLFAVYIIKAMFNDTQMLQSDNSTQVTIFVFYLLNIFTVYFYEIYCNKMNNLKERRT